MGYKEDVDDGAGSIPEFGAIFMSNVATKRECMKQRVFGLPLAQADFVKQVKAGMVLFLFEFERRQLFGVFRAISDGKIDVMSNAFKSSGKKFPAQVHFTPIWNCIPLSEHEFRDAIRDNYYSSKKFRFGLSEDQVHRLLLLFSSRKLKREFHNKRFTSDSRHFHEERRQLDDARILINDRRGLEPDSCDRLNRETMYEHSGNSFERVTHVDHLMHSRGDTRLSKNKIEDDQEQVSRTRTGEFGVKRTRVDSEASFLVNGVTGKVHYDDSPRQGNWNKYFEDSLGPRRIVDDGLFLAGHMVNDEVEVNNNLGSNVVREHSHNSFSGVGVANKDGYQMNEYRLDIGSGLISNEHYNNREAILADDGNFLTDNFSGRNQHDVDIVRGTIFTDEQQREYQREREIDSGTYSMNNLNSFGPDMSTEHIGISMGGGTRTTDKFRFSDIEKDRESNILMEHPLGIARRSTNVSIYPVRERLKHEHSANESLGLTTSTDYSRFDSVDERRIGGGSRFRESDMEETGSQLGISRGHVNISPSRISKSTYTGNPCFQTEISSPLSKTQSSLLRYPEDHYIPRLPRSISEDATRTVPYDPELPDIYRGHSSLMRESSPYLLEPRSSGRYFDTSGYGNTHSFPSRNESSYRKTNSSTMNGYSEISEFKNATREGFKGSFYSDPSAHSPPSKVETTESDGDVPLRNSLLSSTKRGYDAASRGKYSYSAGEETTAEGLPSFDVGKDNMESGASFSEARGLPHNDPIDHDNNLCRSRENKGSYTNNRRKSVFARLTSAPEARMLDQDDDIDALSDANDMDTSVEEVMAMLQHGVSPHVRIRNNEVNLKQHDDKGIAISKRATSDQEFEHLKLKMKELGTDQTIEEIGGSILEETRHVNFKRRSKAKKNVEEVSLSKRRRLVRPVFSKKESSSSEEGISSYFDVTENLHENSLKEKESNHEEVVATEGCENSNQVAEKSSECNSEERLVNLHPPSECPEGDCTNYKPKECGWIEC